MKQQQIFQVDLTKIDGVGDFPCPSCGQIISPDDESGATYEIVDVKMKSNQLDKLVIVCNKCKRLIHIKGFETLEQYEDR